MVEFVDKYNDDEEFRRQAVILQYLIPYTEERDYLTTYKVALREVNSHSLVNAGLRVKIDENNVIKRARLVYGAIAPVALSALLWPGRWQTLHCETDTARGG